MRRFQFIELEDQKWCPRSIRDGITDFLQWLDNAGQLYRPVSRRLNRVLRKLKPVRIVDLCSGGGGSCINMFSEHDNLKADGPELCLTDLYPNRDACERVHDKYPERITYHLNSIDATHVPRSMTGFRTLFTSFHHFAPRAAQSIIGDAVKAGQGIGIFEFTQRNLATIAVMFLAPALVLFATPFIRPVRMERLFWTFILPVIPFAVMYDGIISCLRTYTPEEMRNMTHGISGANTYCWKVGLQRTGIPFCQITYLIGYPKSVTQVAQVAGNLDAAGMSGLP